MWGGGGGGGGGSPQSTGRQWLVSVLIIAPIVPPQPSRAGEGEANIEI